MAKSNLEIEVQYSDSDEPLSRRLIYKILQAALPTNAQVTVRFATAAESQATNLQFRGKDKPANVLSFAYTHQPLTGDIIICPQVVNTESKQAGINPADRFAHLLVHAALHLQGMTHNTKQQAAKMEAHETKILTQLGYPAPFA